MPGSNCATLYDPSSLVVTVLSFPVLLSFTTTVAPGITPLASETVPTRRPVFDWASAGTAYKQNININLIADLMDGLLLFQLKLVLMVLAISIGPLRTAFHFFVDDESKF